MAKIHETERLIAAAKELLAAIESAWEGKAEDERQTAISAWQEDAMEELRVALQEIGPERLRR